MPTFVAVAVLVGVLLNAFIEKRADWLRWIFVATGSLLALIGGAFIYLTSTRSSIDLAGIDLLGTILLAGGLSTIVFALIRKPEFAVYSQLWALAAVMLAFVIVVLPDFERYKPVKALSEVITQNAGPDARVGYYRYTAPTMVFYLQRPVLEYFHEEEMTALFADDKPAYMIMTANEYEAIRPKLAAETRVIASRPLLRVRLNELFSERREPQVVLVTNEMQK
jgi:hypothetical protein